MTPSRRALLTAAALSPFAARALGASAAAQPAGAAPAAANIPPILFVHGNGDHAAVWMTVLWRMESNGIPRDRLHAISFTDPSALTDDSEPQPNRSSTADQLRELTEAVAALRRRTGAPRIAMVANSRGGSAVRNYIRNGGADVSHAVLCSVPNHGIFDWDDNLGNEFNGRGPFLRALNAGEIETTAGTDFLTLRSDGNDKYAQPDGRFVAKPGVATGITPDGPMLRGATNLMLGALDHRETAFHPRAFREIYKFIAGREPGRIDIVSEPRVQLSGLVTGVAGGSPTNRPVAGATVEVYRVSGETGERLGEAIYRTTTSADGQWGPATTDPISFLEIVLAVEGSPVTHYYRSPFPRSSAVLNLRPGRALTATDTAAGATVLMTRPRGYFGLPRDIVLLDGQEPGDIAQGVPGDSTSTARLPASEAGRPVVAMFNQERIAARPWPASDNRIAIAEFTF